VRAIDILESLRTSLDMERGGEVAGNLNRLYTYMEARLTEANLGNDTAVLDELSGLNEILRGAWSSIPAEARQRPA